MKEGVPMKKKVIAGAAAVVLLAAFIILKKKGGEVNGKHGRKDDKSSVC